MGSNEYLSRVLERGEKPYAIRRVLLLQPHPQYEKNHPESKKLVDDLYPERGRLREEFSTLCRRVEADTDLLLPLIKIEVSRKTIHGVPVTKIFLNLDKQNEYRIFSRLDLLEVPDDKNNIIDTSRLCISHLVSISCGKGKEGWYPTNSKGLVHVHTSVDKVKLLIIDIVLDIAMFHSSQILVRKFANNTENGQLFSKQKVEFAMKSKLSSYYGPLNRDINYFSIASAARTGSNYSQIDLKKYKNLWMKLVKEYGLGPFIQEKSTVVEEILSRSKRGGQLSVSKLRKSIEDLKPGKYVLILAHRRPKRNDQMITVLSFLHRHKWKMNAWRIILYSELNEALRLETYFHFIRFKI